MRKHFPSLLLLLASILASTPAWAKSEYILSDGIWYYIPNLDKLEAYVSCGPSYDSPASYIGDISIPSDVNYGKPQGSAGPLGYSYHVTQIYGQAFANSPLLTSISIPKSVTSIGGNAFNGCKLMTYIDIPSSVTEIGSSAFQKCASLKSISLPNSITRIGVDAFWDCTSLESISLPNSISEIATSTFQQCTSLTSIDIPKSVTSIGSYAFSGCSSLASITIPNSVTTIKKEAFKNCSSLTSINIPESVTDIASTAFSGCSSLINITVDSNNKCYKSFDGALYNFDCSNILVCPLMKTSITIPSSTTIGNNIFYNCTSLANINVDPQNETIKSIDGVLYNSDCTILIACPPAKTSIKIPNSVTRIQGMAFSGCSKLSSITIPSSVTTIDWAAFEGCSSLTAINVDSENESYKSIDGILYSSDGSRLIVCPQAKTNIAIPNSVNEICNNAFYGCASIKSLTIPESVTELGYNAFTNSAPLIFLKTKHFNTCSGLTVANTVVLHQDALKDTGVNPNAKTVFYYESPVSQTINPYYFDAELKVNPYFDGPAQNVSVSFGDTPISPENGVYSFSNLQPGTSYTVNVNYIDKNGQSQNYVQQFTTLTPSFRYSQATCTHTSVSIEDISVSENKTTPVRRIGCIYNNKDYECSDNNITISNIFPGTYVTLRPYADYSNGERVYFKNIEMFTTPLDIRTKAIVGPTSVRLIGSVNGNIQVENHSWDEIDGDSGNITGLLPETQYTFTYNVSLKDSEASFSRKVTITTDKLELTTLTPKCVSSGCAIVAAQTNISEYETGAGFQWRKYDAPASLAPSEAFATVCEGRLEGRIHNLQTTSYYNIRAFYKDTSGEYTYGDWITFDPSDFSFFEPTVRTYPAEDVSESSATLRGYALAGTDDIISQGFEYWPVTAVARTSAIENVITVECSRQMMQVIICDLKPGTEYAFRSFVVTDKGTAYGEEQTFTTKGEPESGLERIEVLNVTEIARYDLSGVRINKHTRGINIVVYSDGSVRKELVK